jgi:hypothetical protein
MAHGVLNVPMTQVILDQPRVGSLVGQGKAARMAQHVRMNGDGEGGQLAVFLQGQVDGRAVQGGALASPPYTGLRLSPGRPHVRKLR